MQISTRVTRLSLLAGLVAAIAPAAVGPAQAAPAAKGPCQTTPKTFGGDSGMVFCGPATGTLRVAGKTYDFTRGYCTSDRAHGLALQLSLGAAAPSFTVTTNHGQPYLAITLRVKPAGGQLLDAYSHGKQLAGRGSLVPGGASAAHGTFTGKSGTVAFSGSWNCRGPITQV
jgi:hypothetical protein